ncbi:MAG: PEGA domain-containing protein [Bacteroidota bacterium]|jgi:TolB-like protein
MRIIGALFLLISLATAQQLNRRMKVESFGESRKINTETDKSLVLVHSQVQNLRFDSNRKIERVNQVSSSDWEVWLPAGTHILKIDAEGFERLELPVQNYGRKKAYELKIVAVGLASATSADENLIDVIFQINESNVFSSYNDLTPTLTKGNTITYKIPRGGYTFRFQKEGFADEVQKIAVTEATIISIELKQGTSTRIATLPSKVVIKSEPPGAEILINSQKYGKTPFQGEIIAGTLQLELRKPLYYPNISTFTVEEGKALELPVNLKSRFGDVTVGSNVPNIAVMEFDTREGVSPGIAASLSDVFISQLAGTQEFTIEDHNRIKTILQDQEFQQNVPCSQNECIIEACKILRVEKIFVGTVGKIGRIFTVNIQMLDVATGRIQINKNYQHDGDVEELAQDVIPTLALQMAGELTKKDLTSKSATSKSSSKWLWYVGGAAVAGGAAYYFLAPKNNNTTQTSDKLPGPPTLP